MSVISHGSISFQQNEIFEILAEKHQISYNKNVAFRGRLQHFQRLKFPAGVNTGKGNKVRYGWKELFLLGLALEYVEIGSTPDRCVLEIGKYEELILAALARLTASQIDEKEPYFLLTELSGLMTLKRQSKWSDKIELLNQPDIAQIFSAEGDDQFRSPYAIIDLKQFLASMLLAVFEISEHTKKLIVADLREWVHLNYSDI